MAADRRTRAALLRELEALHTRLEEAEETLRAIRSGEVDALLVSGVHGEQVFSLQGAEHPYRVLIEQMSDGAATMTIDGILLYGNRRLAEMLHSPLEKVMGSSLRGFVAPSDQTTFEALLRQAAAGGARGEVALIAADGVLVPAYLSFNTLLLGEAQVLCLVATDLSQQKRQEAMIASERLARSILDQAAEAMVVCDATGQIIRASQAAHRLCGGNPLLQPFNTVFPLQLPGASEQTPDGRLSRPLGTVLRGEVLHGIETTLARSDGQLLSVRISAAPLMDDAHDVIGCVVTLIDITERRRAEVALQRAAERLELLHAIDRAILAAHSSEAIAHAALGHLCTLVCCWRAGLSLFDFQARQGLVLATVGRGEARFAPGTRVPLEAYGSRDLATLQAGQIYAVAEVLTLTSPPATVRTLQAEGLRAYARVPLMWQRQLIGALNLWADGPGGFPPESLAMAREVADLLAVAIQQARLHEQVQRHAAELEARVAARTAELAAANHELEAFSYSASHDLRAPLRSLDGFSQALLEDYAHVLNAEGHDYLQRIRGAAQHMAELIDALLSLSRVTRSDLQWETVELSTMAQSIAAELQRQAPTRPVTWVIAEGLTATGDARLLRIVLENLLGNAWKFTAKQPAAQIVFEALALPDEPPVFFVRDNGAGFDMAYAKEKLFGVFQRLHGMREFPGTGIGLATVQRIVHRHGGRIWAEGVVDQGATFYFTLASSRLSCSSSVAS
jgi:PAS domain S-box-containing protein